jgi:NADH:ubiquinone reductase (H+-translocating)
VLSSDGERVRLAKPEGPEEDLPCAIVVWAAGVSASAVPFGSAAATTRGGRIEVDANLVLPTHPEVFAAGDVAAAPGEVDGSLLPQLAQPAIQGGRHAAEQIARTIAGESLKPLRYHDKGIMATIGRRAAVCELPPRKPGHDDLLLRGTIAWLTWLGLHVYALIGHRNRASVMMNWAWRYIAWKRGPRVIVGG